MLGKLARDLGFPAHFRPNLDALFDVLTTEIPGPIRIDWRLSATTGASLGADLEPLRRTLEDAAAARDDLCLTIDGDQVSGPDPPGAGRQHGRRQ